MTSTNPELFPIPTLAVHAGREGLDEEGVGVPAIDLSTANPVRDVEHGGESYDVLAQGERIFEGGSHVYRRLSNPTVNRFERAVAQMDRCDDSVAFASGMAALSAFLLVLRAKGTPNVVAVRPVYGGTDHLLTESILGTVVNWVASREIHQAVTSDTGAVLVETPANPTVQLIDIADVVNQAGRTPVIVDNTFATSVIQQPSRHGAQLTLQSSTKYVGGHGDLMGGTISTNDEWASELRKMRAITGGLLSPFEAYMLHRGLQTLPVRVRAQEKGAQVIANALKEHPSVREVFYPGLPECDPTHLVGRQMDGPGGMLAFAVNGGSGVAAKVAEKVRVIAHAVSLGSVCSLIQHPASITHRLVEAPARPLPDVLRLSVGVEDPESLVADLVQAIEAADGE